MLSHFLKIRIDPMRYISLNTHLNAVTPEREMYEKLHEVVYLFSLLDKVFKIVIYIECD